MLGIDVPLGIFPEGTTNDVATYFNIPKKVGEYLPIMTSGNISTIDLARVNQDYFINVASAGLLTQTAHEVDHRLKNVMGRMAYYLKTLEKLPKMQPLLLHVNADGQFHDMEIMLFAVLNGGTAGGFKNLMPDADMSDGMLDFLAIKPIAVKQFSQLLLDYKRGLHLKDNRIIYFKARHLLIDVTPRVVTDLDGERGPEFPWGIDVCANALKMRTP